MPDEIDALGEMLDDAGKFEAWAEGKEPVEVEKAARPKTPVDRLQEDLAFAAPEMWPVHIARRMNEAAYEGYEKALQDARTVWADIKREAGDGAAYTPGVDAVIEEILARLDP